MKKSAACLLATVCMGVSGGASAYSLIGDTASVSLTPGFGHVLLVPDSSSPYPVTVVDTAGEFLGLLEANFTDWSGRQYSVGIDLQDDYFTVRTFQTNDWGTVGAFGVGGDVATIYDFSIAGLDGGEAITSVSYNESLSTGILPGFNDMQYVNWTDSTIDIGFKRVREGAVVYHFDINAAPVPIPAAVWLFGSGLLGLIGIARRKFRLG